MQHAAATPDSECDEVWRAKCGCSGNTRNTETSFRCAVGLRSSYCDELGIGALLHPSFLQGAHDGSSGGHVIANESLSGYVWTVIGRESGSEEIVHDDAACVPVRAHLRDGDQRAGLCQSIERWRKRGAMRQRG